MKKEPQNHLITIYHTTGGDITKTRQVETFDLTATEWEQRVARESKRVEASLARSAALDRSE